MPEKVAFTKATITSVDRSAVAGSFRVTAAPNARAAKKLNWGDMPEWEKTSTLRTRLAASKVEITPADASFGKSSIEIDVSRIRDFQFVRKEAKKGKGAGTTKSTIVSVQFVCDFADPEGARKIERYMLTVKDASTVSITYEEEAEQEDLLMNEEQRQATLPEAD